MKKIKELAEHIQEELCDAEEYAKAAILYKDDDKELADMYASLSRQEIEHSHTEHEQVVRMIRDYRNAGNIPQESMMAVWDYLHEKMIQHEAGVNSLLDMYRR